MPEPELPVPVRPVACAAGGGAGLPALRLALHPSPRASSSTGPRRPERFGVLECRPIPPGTEGARRLEGILTEADDEGLTLAIDNDSHRLAYVEIERAKTVFDWQAALRAAPMTDGDQADAAEDTTTTKAREGQR